MPFTSPAQGQCQVVQQVCAKVRRRGCALHALAGPLVCQRHPTPTKAPLGLGGSMATVVANPVAAEGSQRHVRVQQMMAPGDGTGAAGHAEPHEDARLDGAVEPLDI